MEQLYVLGYCIKNDTVLLLRRYNTSFGNGFWSLPGGKVEDAEPALKALARELSEEVGWHVPESVLTLAHVLHRKGTDNALIALCFTVDATHLPEPINKEPHKHDGMQFFPLDALPENMLSAHTQILACIAQQVLYSEHGWE